MGTEVVVLVAVVILLSRLSFVIVILIVIVLVNVFFFVLVFVFVFRTFLRSTVLYYTSTVPSAVTNHLFLRPSSECLYCIYWLTCST